METPSTSPTPEIGSITTTASGGRVLNGPYKITLDHVGDYAWTAPAPIPISQENSVGVSFRVDNGMPEFQVVTNAQLSTAKVEGGYQFSITFTMDNPKALGANVEIIGITINPDDK